MLRTLQDIEHENREIMRDLNRADDKCNRLEKENRKISRENRKLESRNTFLEAENKRLQDAYDEHIEVIQRLCKESLKGEIWRRRALDAEVIAKQLDAYITEQEKKKWTA